VKTANPFCAAAALFCLAACLDDRPVVSPGNLVDPNAILADDTLLTRMDSVRIELGEPGDSGNAEVIWNGKLRRMGDLPIRIVSDRNTSLLYVYGYVRGGGECLRETYAGGALITRALSCPIGPRSDPDGPVPALSAFPMRASIGDSIAFQATTTAAPGKLIRCFWDHDGDGIFDTPPAYLMSGGACKSEWAYPKPGHYASVVKMENDSGAVGYDSIAVDVLLDPPMADAGPDTTVPPGGFLYLTGKASDSLGDVIRMDWSGPGIEFSTVPTTTTMTLPIP
jgi:hypothetical protein